MVGQSGYFGRDRLAALVIDIKDFIVLSVWACVTETGPFVPAPAKYVMVKIAIL